MYEYKDAFELVAEEVTRFEDEKITITPGLEFSQYDTVRMIELYQSSTYESGEYDSDGFHKFFFNIGNSRCDVESKATDLDTKNIRVIGENGENHLPAWLLGKEVKVWLKDNDFGKILNEIVDSRPTYGSVVLKVIAGKPYMVPLRNIILSDPSAESLDKTNIIERHLYSFDELRQTKWDKEAIEEAIKKYTDLKETQVPVYERYGWGPESMFKKDGDAEKYIYGVCMITGVDFGEYRTKHSSKDYDVSGIKLWSETKKTHPYKESHRKKIRGRWLGLGVIETLFEHQMRVNEICNNLAKGGFWSAKHLYQSADEISIKNLLTDAKNGDLLKSMSGITPIAMEERNLTAYLEELKIWLSKADKDAFSFESATGENLPTNTPFRLGFIQQQAVASFFDKKREDIGLFIKEILRDLVIPTFQNQSVAKHFFSIGGNDDELTLLREAIADAILREQMAELAPKLKYVEDIDALKQKVMSQLGSRIFMELPEGYYKNIKYAVEIVITNESVDVDAQVQTASTILQLIGTNPNLLADPTTKAILAQIADDSGNAALAQKISSAKPPQQPMSVSGSVAAPQQNDLVSATKKTAL